MGHEARSIADTAWTPPPDWTPPGWLDPEPEPPALPMGQQRLRWCLHVLGWSFEELSRRIHTHESSVRQMGRGRRAIPDPLALWLEKKAADFLADPLPEGWRQKPD